MSDAGWVAADADASGGKVATLRRCVRSFVESRHVQRAILVAILLNSVSMGIEYHNQVHSTAHTVIHTECSRPRPRPPFCVLELSSRSRTVLPHVVWTFPLFVSLQSAGGRFRFLVPPSGTTCIYTSHLRRQSRLSDNDSRPFCFPVSTNTLS